MNPRRMRLDIEEPDADYVNRDPEEMALYSAEGKRVLDRIARILNTDLAGRRVQVEGHTDSDPIRKTRHLYKNNWELGMKRASGVVEYLVSRGVDPRRIHATSLGANQPISTNKSKNRRVEIVVLPDTNPYSIMGPASMSGTMR